MAFPLLFAGTGVQSVSGASFPIEVKFSPNEERFFNYNVAWLQAALYHRHAWLQTCAEVVCNIKRKEKPLLLNIKGEGEALASEESLAPGLGS